MKISVLDSYVGKREKEIRRLLKHWKNSHIKTF